MDVNLTSGERLTQGEGVFVERLFLASHRGRRRFRCIILLLCWARGFPFHRSGGGAAEAS